MYHTDLMERSVKFSERYKYYELLRELSVIAAKHVYCTKAQQRTLRILFADLLSAPFGPEQERGELKRRAKFITITSSMFTNSSGCRGSDA
jgi:hypothetical protein